MFKRPSVQFGSNCKVYVVGGCIRDYFMNIEPMDIDYVVVGATEQDMLNAGLQRIGSDFYVYINQDGDEFALARTERKTGNGYKGFTTNVAGVTLEDDLKRRDFTINSIAYDFDSQSFIDPLNGIDDISNQLIKMSNPIAFSEDPLRILRLARFSSRFANFTVDFDTIKAARHIPNAELEMSSIPVERINAEFEKMWQQAMDPTRFFGTLLLCKMLQIVIPELYELLMVEENLTHHPEGSTYNHTMLALKQAHRMGLSVDEFWMVLTHDFGKALTADTIAHHNHEKDGLPIVEDFCTRLRLSIHQTNMCKLFCEHHMRFARINEMKPYTIAKMLNDFKVEHTKDIITSIAKCSLADQAGRDKECAFSFRWSEIHGYMNAYASVNGQHVSAIFNDRDKPVPKGNDFKRELLLLRAKEIAKVKKEIKL